MKHAHYFIITALLLLAVLPSGCSDMMADLEKTKDYALRDTGPAGGLIFYINPSAETDGWKYLECAPASTEWTDKVWGGMNQEISGADGQAIGTGKQNTVDIVTAFGDAEPGGQTDYAAKLCSDIEYGGYDDWFLPSRDELNKIYVNLHSGTDENSCGYTPVGGFADLFYWSSSEVGGTNARFQRFGDGYQDSTKGTGPSPYCF